MLNYLLGCSRQTTFGMIPDIINHNNEAVQKEFNYIYDASLNRLTKSVYAPTGSVKAHMGEFVNLSVEYITIKNIESLKDSIQLAVDEIIRTDTADHNFLNGRFKNPSDACLYSDDTCHDAKSIGYTTTMTVNDAIIDLYSKNSERADDISIINDNIVAIKQINQKQNVSIYDVTSTADSAYTLANTANEGVGYCNDNINEIRDKLNYTCQRVDKHDVSVQNMQDDVDKNNLKVDEIDAKISTYDASLAKMNASCILASKDADDAKKTVSKYDASITAIQNGFTALNDKVDLLDGKVDTFDGRIIKTEKSCTDNTKSINIINASNAVFDISILNNINDIHNVQKSVSIMQASIGNISSAITAANASINKLESYVTNHDKQINVLNASVKKHDDDIARHDTSIKNLITQNTNQDSSITALKQFAVTAGTSIGNMNTSIATHDTQLTSHNSQITSNTNAISVINNKIPIMDTSINDISAGILDLARAINHGQFQIMYNGTTYSITSLVSRLIDLYNWYLELTPQTITYKDGNDNVHTITVICEAGTSQLVSLANNGLGILTGNHTPITNPEEYTLADINNANTRMTSLIGPRS